MKKNFLKKIVKEEIGEDYVNEVVETVEAEIERYGTNYNSLYFRVVDDAPEKITIEYSRPGYRKNTTNEYVPNSYRANFGWKNTYYSPASLEITYRRP